MSSDYASIPQPTADNLLDCINALKQTVEALIGVRGTSDSTAVTGTVTTTPAGHSLTLPMLVQQPAKTLLGNSTAAAGDVVALTVAQVMTLLAAASLTTQDQTLSGGANVTTYANTAGSFTIDCGKCPLQSWTNSGAATITAPAADGSCMILITNTTAGALTFSGFSVSASTGDALDTTSGHKFILTIVRIGGTATYAIKALQ